eukprot:Gb_13627 [translate_table: standard]
MGYNSLVQLVTISTVMMGLSWHAIAQTCPVAFSSETKIFSSCKALPQHGATLSWTYHPENGSVDVAFRAKPAASAGWVAWGINPNGTRMIGTQALIAFRHSNGSTIVDTYDVESKSAQLQPSKISLAVANKSAVYENGEITIFATVSLPSNKTTVNQVWQVGSAVEGLSPRVHAFNPANLQSFGSIDLALNSTTPTTNADGGPSPSPTAGDDGSGSFPNHNINIFNFLFLPLFLSMFMF